MDKIVDIRLELGKRMRKLRKLRGITIEKVADKADLNEHYYGEIERGKRNVTLVNLQKVAIGLDVTIGELFRFPTEKPLSEEGEEFIALVTRLLQKGSKKKVRMAVGILKELVD